MLLFVLWKYVSNRIVDLTISLSTVPLFSISSKSGMISIVWPIAKSELLELGMIQRERKGRSFELSVTSAFLEYFGIEAQNQSEMKAYLEKALSSSWIVLD